MAAFQRIRNRSTAGLTLLELLVVFFIASILLLITVPMMHRLVTKVVLQSKMRQFIYLLQYARMQALERHHKVAVCGSRQAQRCDGDWSSGIWVKLLDSDATLRVDRQLPRTIYLNFKSSFGYNQALIYLEDGSVSNQGSFYLCATPACRNGKRLVISLSARIRVEDLH